MSIIRWLLIFSIIVLAIIYTIYLYNKEHGVDLDAFTDEQFDLFFHYLGMGIVAVERISVTEFKLYFYNNKIGLTHDSKVQFAYAWLPIGQQVNIFKILIVYMMFQNKQKEV